jgi:tape measure domain-containing protein
MPDLRIDIPIKADASQAKSEITSLIQQIEALVKAGGTFTIGTGVASGKVPVGGVQGAANAAPPVTASQQAAQINTVSNAQSNALAAQGRGLDALNIKLRDYERALASARKELEALNRVRNASPAERAAVARSIAGDGAARKLVTRAMDDVAFGQQEARVEKASNAVALQQQRIADAAEARRLKAAQDDYNNAALNRRLGYMERTRTVGEHIERAHGQANAMVNEKYHGGAPMDQTQAAAAAQNDAKVQREMEQQRRIQRDIALGKPVTMEDQIEQANRSGLWQVESGRRQMERDIQRREERAARRAEIEQRREAREERATRVAEERAAGWRARLQLRSANFESRRKEREEREARSAETSAMYQHRRDTMDKLWGGMILSGAGASLMQVPRYGLSQYGQARKAQIGLQAIEGANAPQVMAQARADAKDLFGASYRDVINQQMMLRQAGQTTGQARSSVLALADINAATGGSADRLHRNLYNLSQVEQQGKLTGRDLRDFAVNMVPIREALSRQMGISSADVAEKVSKGEVSADIVRQAILSIAQDPRFAGRAKALSEGTPEGQWEKTREEMEQTAELAGETLAPAMMTLNKAMRSGLEWMQDHPGVVKAGAWGATGLGLGATAVGGTMLASSSWNQIMQAFGKGAINANTIATDANTFALNRLTGATALGGGGGLADNALDVATGGVAAGAGGVGAAAGAGAGGAGAGVAAGGAGWWARTRGAFGNIGSRAGGAWGGVKGFLGKTAFTIPDARAGAMAAAGDDLFRVGTTSATTSREYAVALARYSAAKNAPAGLLESAGLAGRAVSVGRVVGSAASVGTGVIGGVNSYHDYKRAGFGEMEAKIGGATVMALETMTAAFLPGGPFIVAAAEGLKTVANVVLDEQDRMAETGSGLTPEQAKQMKGMTHEQKAAYLDQQRWAKNDEATALQDQGQGYFARDFLFGDPNLDRKIENAMFERDRLEANARRERTLARQEKARQKKYANEQELKNYVESQGGTYIGQRDWTQTDYTPMAGKPTSSGPVITPQKVRSTGDGGRIVTLLLPPSSAERDLQQATAKPY